jgi:hypothetical protein
VRNVCWLCSERFGIVAEQGAFRGRALCHVCGEPFKACASVESYDVVQALYRRIVELEQEADDAAIQQDLADHEW